MGGNLIQNQTGQTLTKEPNFEGGLLPSGLRPIMSCQSRLLTRDSQHQPSGTFLENVMRLIDP